MIEQIGEAWDGCPTWYKWGDIRKETSYGWEHAAQLITEEWKWRREQKLDVEDMKRARMKKDADLRAFDQAQRQGDPHDLVHPKGHFKEIFHGRMWTHEGVHIFEEDGTTCRVEVTVSQGAKKLSEQRK